MFDLKKISSLNKDKRQCYILHMVKEKKKTVKFSFLFLGLYHWSHPELFFLALLGGICNFSFTTAYIASAGNIHVGNSWTTHAALKERRKNAEARFSIHVDRSTWSVLLWAEWFSCQRQEWRRWMEQGRYKISLSGVQDHVSITVRHDWGPEQIG